MRTSALWLWNHELKSIDIEQARIYVSSSSEEAKVNISLELADYSRKPSTFNIRLHLPESLHNHFQAEQYEFDYSYNFSRGARWHIQETITVPRTWTADPDDFRWFCEQWVDITLVFELYNEEHSVKFRSR
ncbi:MAG: hypothetical protein FH749_01395 [Firmicutes bacterium]|nr:hypothetical protein [Bacillota bacterium]